ncbi:hypothetical protein KP509_02G077400 [Ceratopteris richardii]|uniref:Uncharacterized protein n=1 Tax=Ceratopteris richardii TaxID=49495 RepID=A0A8T2VEI2_CERRI|nr:hypothetical protein KP509_02G077400 [Ceratopteris richardii]
MMALRRTWDVGLRLCQERIAPAVLQRSVFHLSFSSKADVDDFDGEKKDKGKRKKETFVATKDVGKPACEVSQLEDDPDSTLIKALKKQLKDAIELVDNYQTTSLKSV